MVSKKEKLQVCWFEDNKQGVPKWIWASIIFFLHHKTLILSLKDIIKKELKRILICKAYGRDISYRKEKSWKLDILYIELKSPDLEILPLNNPLSGSL